MDHFLALADPTRRQIIESLCTREHSFGELADQFEMSRPAVSQHLKVLKETGFVSVRVQAQRRIYRINDEGLAEVDVWLSKVRRFWTHSLTKLEQELEQATPSTEKNK